MKVLVIGSGGREHAICWKLKRSPLLSELWCVPGNPGIAEIAKCVPISVEAISDIAQLAVEEGFDLTVVGPEVPLSLGIVDEFEKRGLPIIGPSARASRLESSKAFAKEIMRAARVPTADYKEIPRSEIEAFAENCEIPIVLKADSLAAGKGVFVCLSRSDTIKAADVLARELKPEIVIAESFLSGVEASFIVLTDGKRVVAMPTSHDYKRLHESDLGPNTGGMGSVSPTPRMEGLSDKKVIDLVITPILAEMSARGMPFRGFLYAGLMIEPNGEINVLEYNVRLGDPECQSLMRRIDSDFLELLVSFASGNSEAEVQIAQSKNNCVTIVLAADGYPDNPAKGDLITGIENCADPSVEVFHAGTARNSAGALVTSGGRVLAISAIGLTLQEARAKAHEAASKVGFRGKQYRQDIGQ